MQERFNIPTPAARCSAKSNLIGAGLGLSIGRQITTVHGWDLQARRSEPGIIFDLKINSSEPRTSGVL